MVVGIRGSLLDTIPSLNPVDALKELETVAMEHIFIYGSMMEAMHRWQLMEKASIPGPSLNSW